MICVCEKRIKSRRQRTHITYIIIIIIIIERFGNVCSSTADDVW